MWKIKRPSRTAVNSFNACIISTWSQSLKKRLKAIEKQVEDSADDFLLKASNVNLHNFPRSGAIGRITADQMIALYEEGMLDVDSPGRKVYNYLIKLAGGECPLCGYGTDLTMDHHLPKSKYTLLVVSPINLVPACSLCNKKKSHRIPKRKDNNTIHPYFEGFEDEQWLCAEVVERKTGGIKFSYAPPSSWNAVLVERVRNQIGFLKLLERYSVQANSELKSRKSTHLRYFNKGKKYFKQELQAQADDLEVDLGINHWKTATYAALAQSKWYCDGKFHSA